MDPISTNSFISPQGSFPSSSFTQTVPPQHKKDNTLLWIFLAILLFGTGFSVAKVLPDNISTLLSSQTTTTPIQLRQLTPTPDPTANWKTYSDQNKVYEFKYPQNYSLSHFAGDNSPILLNNQIDWEITQHSAGECKGDCPVIINKRDATINGYQATIYNGWVGSVGGEIPQTFIKYEVREPGTVRIDGSNYFVITLWELDRRYAVQKNYSSTRNPGTINQDDQITFDQILSTFRFLDQNKNSNWQTFLDKKIGISVQYPNDFKVITQYTDDGSDFPNTLFAIKKENSFPGYHLKTRYIFQIKQDVNLKTSTACYVKSSDGSVLTKFKMINGSTFYYSDTYGGAASGTHEIKQDYKVFKDIGSICVEVNFRYFESSDWNEPKELELSNSDQKSALTIFDQILSTFKFM